MNETVKAALLAARSRAQSAIRLSEHVVMEASAHLSRSTSELGQERRRLADIELHLRDNGVDLAAVDAEAEKARVLAGTGLGNGPMQDMNSQGLTQSYGRPLGSLNGQQ